MLDAWMVPAKTSPPTMFPPIASNELEPRPDKDAVPFGPLPDMFTLPNPLPIRK